MIINQYNSYVTPPWNITVELNIVFNFKYYSPVQKFMKIINIIMIGVQVCVYVTLLVHLVIMLQQQNKMKQYITIDLKQSYIKAKQVE